MNKLSLVWIPLTIKTLSGEGIFEEAKSDRFHPQERINFGLYKIQ